MLLEDTDDVVEIATVALCTCSVFQFGLSAKDTHTIVESASKL